MRPTKRSSDTVRVVLRVPAKVKARWLREAKAEARSLSKYVLLAAGEWVAPTQEEVEDALAARGSLAGTGLRERIAEARKTPWTVPPVDADPPSSSPPKKRKKKR